MNDDLKSSLNALSGMMPSLGSELLYMSEIFREDLQLALSTRSPTSIAKLHMHMYQFIEMDSGMGGMGGMSGMMGLPQAFLAAVKTYNRVVLSLRPTKPLTKAIGRVSDATCGHVLQPIAIHPHHHPLPPNHHHPTTTTAQPPPRSSPRVCQTISPAFHSIGAVLLRHHD